MYIERKIAALLAGRYEIGILNNTIEDIVSGKPLNIQLVKHSYKDRWFADPFVLDVKDNHIELLVEEYYYPEKKGRIAKLTIDRKKYKVIDNKPILNIDTHLSFPVIRRCGDNVYVIPENGQLGKLICYQYDKTIDKLIPIETIIEMPLADAVDVRIDNDKYLFCTICPDHSGSQLSIYKEEEGRFIPYQTYDFGDEKNARMAGDFFTYKGKLYRPCQDCNDRYGYGFLIQEVVKNDNNFVFKTVSKYTSPIKRWNLGLHTFNSYKGLMVTDVLGYTVHPSMTKFLGYTLGAIRRMKSSLS